MFVTANTPGLGDWVADDGTVFPPNREIQRRESKVQTERRSVFSTAPCDDSIRSQSEVPFGRGPSTEVHTRGVVTPGRYSAHSVTLGPSATVYHAQVVDTVDGDGEDEVDSIGRTLAASTSCDV